MTGSTSEHTPRRLAVAVALGAALVAALTALVFLARAGGDPGDAATWPITWELRSSDNGTLFQFWADVAAGRALDWSFSPQVYVFPELPVSGLAFLLAGGDLYVYYVAVATLNQVAFFLVLVALARALWSGATPATVVGRAGLAVAPLLVLPLVGTTWVLSFHLAPTYYVGMYLALLAAPLLLLVRTRVSRILLATGLALTIASNPLTVVFAAPALLAVTVVRLVRSGRRGLRRTGLLLGAVALGAVVARLAFTPLQGTGLLTYMDLEVFASRVDGLWPYWSFQLLDPAARVLLPLGALLGVGCLVVGLGVALVLARRTSVADERRAYTTVFLALVPLGGLAATVTLLITHPYYFWPALVLPLVLALFAIPERAVRPGLIVASLVLAAVGVATGAPANLGDVERYFGYRNAETRCLDAAVPRQVGFATFSDARRVGLPSATGIRLIQLGTGLEPNLWLTNRAYAHEGGTFFYLNEVGDELSLDRAAIVARFGAPDAEVACAEGQALWLYDAPVRP